jgi:hypothetical protein
MKVKRMISTALTLALALLTVPAGVPATAASAPSAWAVTEMNEANMLGLLTPNAQKDFQRLLTRAEFCELVVALIERTLGYELPLPASNPFSDTSNIDVQKASLYGGAAPVVNGVGGGLFAPNQNVARQEIVAMMIRALNRMSIDTNSNLLPIPPVAALPFTDNSLIDAYAVEPVKAAYANGIIKGDDVGEFKPRANIKSEECVAVVKRSDSSAQAILNKGLSDSALADKTARDLNIGFAYGDTYDGVSQNILLPSVGAGGADVTWTSGSPGVISATGVVYNVSGASPVTLTATVSIRGVTRTRQFV